MSSSKLKVYELAKELGQDAQHLVDVVQRLGIDIKNSMSVLGTEEVRTVREYFRKQKPLTKATAAAAAASAAKPASVSEKRVGATVIRRRAKTAAEVKAEEEAAAPEVVEEEQVEATEEEQAEMQAQAEQEAAEENAPQEAEAEASEEPQVEEVPEVAASTDTTSAAPAAPVPPPVKKKFYPSIIKKMATESHLTEKVGAKPALREKKEIPKPAAKPAAPKTGVGATQMTGADGLKRIKEVEFVSPEVAKETRKRVMERQNAVFKNTDYLRRELVHATKKKKAVMSRPNQKTQLTKPAEHKRIVEMGKKISVNEFARATSQKAGGIIGKLMGLGVTATMNDTIDFDTATLVAQELGFEIKQKIFREEDFIAPVSMEAENVKPRAPVVTIMGHVDHGKTSLLDAIRKAKVAEGEAGGITQHVGAYNVKTEKGKIAFIDTPGHEAFTAMRARGAKVTDIVVLVVSATDGVMPQTVESIAHAKAANVPIVVAVNKIDLPDAQPERIKQTLAGQGLNPEEWGGDTIYVSVSAKTGKGLDQLLEAILLQAEVLELKANFDAPARGAVVESRLDKFRGPVGTVLVQQGKLKTGDLVVSGTASGKIKAMTNSNGDKVTVAEPGDPVEILGLNGVPTTGDTFAVVNDEKVAKALVAAREEVARGNVEARPKLSVEQMIAAPQAGDFQEVRLILKVDVQGSAEALKEAMTKFPQDKVKLKVLHVATGGVTESDVMLAAASEGVILGFNVRPDVKAQKVAEAEGVQIKSYSIIYELLDDVKKLLEGMLVADIREKVIGRAEVRNVFHIPKIGAIAGSAVIDGKVVRGCFARLLRDSRVVYEGKISSLKRFKEDVREVQQGFECGIGLDGFNDVKMGDQFEAFVKEEVKGVL